MSNIKLSPDELAFHKVVYKQMSEALVIRNSWFGHLTNKYELTNGDLITDDGVIIKQSTPQMPPPNPYEVPIDAPIESSSSHKV